MIKTDITKLAQACCGKLIGRTNASVSDIKIDNRNCVTGDMFVCIIGENNDGHKYAEGAYELGCRAFLMSEQNAANDLLIAHDDASVIVVEDTIKAFEMMAEWYISQFDIRKVAVTGSVGKTTTKKLTAAVLGEKYNTICTQKNLNTNLGLCLTCFMADETTEAIVFEMGMDGKGQIDEYVSFIKPEIALITNIGISHMERLGSREAIASAKLEIVNRFTEENVLVVNSDSEYLQTESEIRARAENKVNYKIVAAGKSAAAKNIVNNGPEGVEFDAFDQHFVLPLVGEHNIIDACLAIAAGIECGVSTSEAAEGLKKVESTDRRFNVEQIGNITLIDDSYNASPDSMKAGLNALSGFKGRKIAVLSDMYELGEAEEEGHIDVGISVAENGIDFLFAVGMNRRLYAHGVSIVPSSKTNVLELENNESAKQLLSNFLKDGDVVFVKGSNSTMISEVAEYIRKADLQ